MTFSEEYCFKFEYGYEEAKREEFTTLPYRIEPAGDEYGEIQYIRIPKHMKLVDVISGEEEIFVFNENNKYGAVGYTPIDEEGSKYKVLVIMTDGSFVLGGKDGNEISFDPAGRFDGIRARVAKGLSQGNYRVKFDYEFENGQPRIEEAHVMKKDQTTTLYAVKYEYGEDGRLCKVITPTAQKVEVGYDRQKVMMTKR